MRTGTHYFPRGVAAIERNRQKFGLKKIDETASESTNIVPAANKLDISPVGCHRKSESCDSRHERETETKKTASAPMNGFVCNTGEKCGSMRSMDVIKMLQPSQMSSDLQSHLGYRSYRGFECMSICIFSAVLFINFDFIYAYVIDSISTITQTTLSYKNQPMALDTRHINFTIRYEKTGHRHKFNVIGNQIEQ